MVDIFNAPVKTGLLAKSWLLDQTCNNCDNLDGVMLQKFDKAKENIKITGCKLMLYTRLSDKEMGAIAPDSESCDNWCEVI